MATLAERLVDAEGAYHDLLTGKGVRALTDQNGERIEYSRTDATALKAYIADLKSSIAADLGLTPAITGPMRSYFC